MNAPNTTTWGEMRFGDLYALPIRSGLMRPSHVRGRGVKMVNMKEIFSFDRINDQEMELVPLSSEEEERFALKQGDLLFARQSLVAEGAGKCSIIISVPETTTFESHILRIRLDKERADPLFYYFYFKSRIGKYQILSLVNQVAAAGIRSSDLTELKVPYPPLPEQKLVSDTLSAFDEKIENNNQTIVLIEKLAQAIFKKSFVGTYSAKNLPKGWRNGTLEELIQNVTERYNGNNGKDLLPYIPIDEITSKRIVIEKNADPNAAQSSLIRFQKGDILFGAMRPYFHKVAIAPYEGLTRTTCFVLRPKNLKYSMFLAFLLFSKESVSYVTSHSEGTTIPYAKWKGSFADMPIVIPPDNIAEEFNTAVLPLVEQMEEFVIENRRLAEMRDLLLPQLVSKKI